MKKNYRKQQMDFHAALFAGGTIKPLMASGAYSRITQHRVRELVGMFADALRGRVDN